MKPDEFEHILARTRLKSRAARCARRVLVDGISKAEAARLEGVTREAAGAAVARVLRHYRPADWVRVAVIVPVAAVDAVRAIERREIKRAGLLKHPAKK